MGKKLYLFDINCFWKITSAIKFQKTVTQCCCVMHSCPSAVHQLLNFSQRSKFGLEAFSITVVTAVNDVSESSGSAGLSVRHLDFSLS